VNRLQGTAASTPPPAPVLVGGAAGAAPNTYTLTAPRTQQDIDAIRERRSELSAQLESAASRRSEIAEELKSLAEGPVRAGLEQRMAVLDQRILQLEADIAETGRQLTSAPAGLLATTESPLAQFGIEPHGVV
jgi:septal ring factor EnvC (AmiA/AmiB activator)